jgi:clan AA aspartic protease (TIGR02281 family)
MLLGTFRGAAERYVDALDKAWFDNWMHGCVAVTFSAWLSLVLVSNAGAQSFDCKRARAPDEIVICSIPKLGTLDEKMVGMFLALRSASTESEKRLLTMEQATWLKERSVCGADSNCIQSSYERRIKQLQTETVAKSSPQTTVAVPSPPSNSESASTNTATSQTAVQLKSSGGTFVVPIQINGAITLDFVIDSGAADVAIPADVFSTLVRTGTIKESDFIGKQTYEMADGSEVPSATFIIRSLKIGNNLIESVKGSITPAQGSLLLGQSFLQHFQSWSIDNSKHVLTLILAGSDSDNPAKTTIDTTTQPTMIAPLNCDQLWYQRNSIYKANGYCFRTSRAIQAFGNAGCSYNNDQDVPLSAKDRQTLDMIQGLERSKGCGP